VNFDFITDSRYHFFEAFWMTVQLTALAAIGSLVFGTLLAAMRVSPVPVMRAFGTVYVAVVRNTPLTVIILAMAIVLRDTLGIALTDSESLTYVKDSTFRMAVLGFVLYTSAFVCEAVRSGISTVPPGQAEAGRALGLTFVQVLRLVVLPQALRSVVVPLANVLIALTKNTTVASAIGVAEAGLLFSEVVENEGDVFAPAVVFATGFVILTLPTGLLLGWVARRVAVRR